MKPIDRALVLKSKKAGPLFILSSVLANTNTIDTKHSMCIVRLFCILLAVLSLVLSSQTISAQAFYFNVTDVTEMNHCGEGEFEFVFGSDGTNGAFSHFECERSSGGIVSCPFDPELQVQGLMSFTKEVPIDADIYHNFIGGNPIRVRAVTEQNVRTNWVTMSFSGDYRALPAPAFSQTNFEACAGETVTISPNNTSLDLVWSTTPYFFPGDILSVPGNVYQEMVLANTDKTLWVARRVDDCQSVQGRAIIRIKGHSKPALSFDPGQVPQGDFCSTADLDVQMTSHIATYVEWSVEPHIAELFVNMPTSGTLSEFTDTKFRFNESFQLNQPSNDPSIAVPTGPVDVTFTFTSYNSEHCAGSQRSFTARVLPVLQEPSVCYRVTGIGSEKRFSLFQTPDDASLKWFFSHNDMGGPYTEYDNRFGDISYMHVTQDTWFKAQVDQHVNQCATTEYTNVIKIKPNGVSNCDGSEGQGPGGGDGTGCEIFTDTDNPFDIRLSHTTIEVFSDSSFRVDLESHNGEFEISDVSVSLGGDTHLVTGETSSIGQSGDGQSYFLSQTLSTTQSAEVVISYTISVQEKNNCGFDSETLHVTVKPATAVGGQCELYANEDFNIQTISPTSITICSGESVNIDATTNGPADLTTLSLIIPNTSIGRGELTSSGTNTNWSFSEVLTNTTENDITVIAKVSVQEMNNCGTPEKEFQLTVKPNNATGEMLFDSEPEPPAFGLSAGNQIVPITMGAGHHGAPVEIFTRPNGSSTWTSRGQIAVGGSLDVTFNQTTSIKAETTASSCATQSESATELISFSNDAQWANGFPEDYTICSNNDVHHVITSNIAGVEIRWVRDLIYGEVYNGWGSGSYYKSGTLGSNGVFNQELKNYTSSNAKVRYTFTQYDQNDVALLSNSFEVIVRSHEERSVAQATLTEPASICGASSGKVQLVTYSFGQFHWERIDLSTYNSYSGNIDNAPWQLVSNPSDSQYVAENTVFRVVATGNCVDTRYGPPTQETTVHIVTDPVPMISNKADMEGDIDYSICTGESFTQPIEMSNNYGVFDWFSTVLEGSIHINHWTESRGLNKRTRNLSRTIINTGDTDAIVEYKIYTRIHGCYGDTAVVKVRVSPIISTGQLITGTDMLCSPDSVMVTHQGAVGSRFIWSKWTPNFGWQELGTDWSSKNFHIDETSVFKVEAYGDCQHSANTIAYSDTIRYVSPTYLAEADIYVAQTLTCDNTTLEKLGDDWESWYWQPGPGEDNFSTADNVKSKILTEGSQLYLRKKELDCWGPVKTIDVSYLDEPATLASDIHRFGAGKAALKAALVPGVSYHWNGPNGFVGISESTVFEDVPLGESGFSVKAISDEQCSSSLFVPVTVTAHPVPRSMLNGPQFLGSPQPTSIVLTSSTPGHVYDSINWYRDGELMTGETGMSVDVSTPGSYWARITLPDGTAMNTAPTKIMSWSNDPYTPPAGGVQPPSASSTTAIPGLGSMNYTRVLVTREAISDHTQVLLESPADQVSAVTTYTDGFGRQVQSVARAASFAGNDQVSVAAYDELGRSTRQYMSYAAPASDGGFRPHPFDEQHDFYDTPGPGIAGTSRPYSQVLYEASPLNRVLETAAAGEPWDPGTTWETPSRRTTRYHHRTNHSQQDGDIQCYFLDGVMLDSHGTYPNHSLKVTEMKSPMNHIVQTFTTRRGLTVLRRVKGEDDLWADTYYVYDDLDQLVLLLTPEAVRIIGTPDYANSNGIAIIQADTTLSGEPDRSYVYGDGVEINLTVGFHAKATDVDSVFSISPGSVNIVIPAQNLTAYEAYQHLYLFEYDERRRLIRKKVPGADWEVYAYDQWDRLVLSQSGHMRENGLSQYNFVKYDAWNRPVMSGVVSLTDPIETIRQDLMAHSARYESATPTGEIGYTTNATYPTIAVAGDVHNVVYFDDYSFPDQATYAFVPGAGMTAAAYQDTAITSLMTGARTRILDGTGGWLRSAYYYDHKYRPVMSVSDNTTGGVDHAYQYYAFRGVVEKSVLVHNATSATPLKVTREYSYDHMDRVLSVTHQLGDIAADKVTLASYEYNELGQVITQNLHQASGEIDYLQQMDLRYHIHGQLSAINDPDNPSANNGRLKDVFALKLDYDQGFDRPQYSGQVAGATWYTRSHMEDAPATATFGYVYDSRQQLRMADYSGTDDYTTRVTEYDQNGNIMAMERQGKTEVATGMIDQLSYDYLANQIQTVDDQSGLDGGYEDGASQPLELEYDHSGNLTRERNTGVNAVTYNHLNLPTLIELGDSRSIRYIYNGSGARLRAEYYEEAEMVRKITYAGQFYYEDDVLGQVFTETGRIVNDDNGRASGAPDGWDGVDYQYMLADHLGNSRVVLSSIPERHVTVTATHEDEYLADELKVFDMGIRESGDQLLDHTHIVTGNTDDHNTYVKVTGQVDDGDGINETIGTMAMLQVQAGDRVDLKAYAKYIQGGSDTNIGAEGIIAALASAFGFNPNSGETGAVFDLFNQANSAMAGLMEGSGGDEPDAYLQYLFFDKNFNFLNNQGEGFDFHKVNNTATGLLHQELTLSKTFTEDGYIFVFVSNSSSQIPVYFDDLTIDYTMNPIDQTSDYYPFGGLMGSGFERIISKANDFRYQGKEYDKDLQWYDFHARQYDPYLGRFLAADPLMQFSSPYNGMGNNPINLIDPTGMSARGRRCYCERDRQNEHADPSVWGGGFTPDTYGGSFYGSREGIGYGSYGSSEHQGYEGAVRGAKENGGKAEYRQGEWGYWVDNDEQTVTWQVDNGVLTPTVTGQRSIWVESTADDAEQGANDESIDWLQLGEEFLFGSSDPNVIHATVPDLPIGPGGPVKVVKYVKDAKKVIVIGEKMAERVIPYAKKINATWFKPRGTNPANWMRNQVQWIRRQIKDPGTTIIDIGPKGAKPVSPYYQKELDMLRKWLGY